MFKRKPFAWTVVACAVVGFATAGCEYDDVYGDDPYEPIGQASPAPLYPLPSAGEASPTEVIALSQPATETIEWLNVESPAFNHNGAIPERFTSSGNGDVPELKWSGVPTATESFVLIAEDPDSVNPRPFVHLIVYNIPGRQRGLTPQDVGWAQSNNASGMTLGRNSSGTLGYAPPSLTMGQPQHTYHFQVFAVNSVLGLAPGADKQAVIDAMKGHVLAKGETVGKFPGR